MEKRAEIRTLIAKERAAWAEFDQALKETVDIAEGADPSLIEPACKKLEAEGAKYLASLRQRAVAEFPTGGKAS